MYAGWVERLEVFTPKLLEGCRRLYAERLVTLAIFGSWAREAATPCSDLDLLIVAEDLPRGRGRRLREFETVEEETLPVRFVWGGDYPAVSLSPVIKTPEEVLVGSPLFLDMTDWCRLLWDRDGFFAEYLAGLRERMKKLGARRRWAKGGYYWEYKPDLQPGENIEL